MSASHALRHQYLFSQFNARRNIFYVLVRKGYLHHFCIARIYGVVLRCSKYKDRKKLTQIPARACGRNRVSPLFNPSLVGSTNCCFPGIGSARINAGIRIIVAVCSRRRIDALLWIAYSVGQGYRDFRAVGIRDLLVTPALKRPGQLGRIFHKFQVVRRDIGTSRNDDIFLILIGAGSREAAHRDICARRCYPHKVA